MNPFKPSRKLHWIKNLYRRWRDGAGCCDTSSLEYYLARKILPALMAFRKHSGTHPVTGGINSEEDWKAVLDKMIWSFQFLLDGEPIEPFSDELCEQLLEKEQDGFKLFGEHFRDLWW